MISFKKMFKYKKYQISKNINIKYSKDNLIQIANQICVLFIANYYTFFYKQLHFKKLETILAQK